MTGIPPHLAPHATGTGLQIVRVPPPSSFYLVVLLTIALVAAWGMYVEQRFRKCRCDKPPTILKPKWKKHEEDE